MADRTPIETKNLDIYGNATLPWSRPHDFVAAVIFFGTPCFLGTTRPDGRRSTCPGLGKNPQR